MCFNVDRHKNKTMALKSSDCVHHEDDGSGNSPPNDKTDGKEAISANKHIERAYELPLRHFLSHSHLQKIS